MRGSTKCVVIGDVGETDMLAAHAAGTLKVLVKTGWGENSLNAYRDKWKAAEPDYIANDLSEAVKWIIEWST